MHPAPKIRSIVDVPVTTVRHLPSRRTPSAAVQRSRDRWLLLGLMLAGLAIRFDFLAAAKFVVDADEAVVGLMAKHMAEGGPIPVFYYGQHYMGSLEPLLVSVLFRVFGVSTVALRIVPAIFAIALIPLVYQIGLTLGSRRAGIIAAVLCAVPPVGLVVWSVKARGGFIELVYIGAYALLLTIRWCALERPALRGSAVIGLVLGFGWWTNNQIVFFMLPIAVVMALRLLSSTAPLSTRARRCMTHAVVGCAGFFVGGLPFWLYNVRYHFVSFQMLTGAPRQSVASHVEGLFTLALPILLGAKRFWEADDIFPDSTPVAYALYGIVLAGACVAYRHQLFALFRLRLEPEPPTVLLLLFFGVTCSVFVLSSFGHLVSAPRYLLPSYVALFVLAGLTADSLSRLSPPLGYMLVAGIFSLDLASAYAGGRAVPGEPIVYGYERVSRDHGELDSWLLEHHITFVRTNYWIGYRLAFETGERVRFLVYREPRQTRIESYEAAGRGIPPAEIPLVLTPTQGAIVEAGLQALGNRYEKAILSGYTVLWHITRVEDELRPIASNRFSVSSDQRPDLLPSLFDHDVHTRWGSSMPQVPGMQIRLAFREPTTLRGIAFDLGDWPQDYPRSLIINARVPDGSIVTIMNEAQYFASRYFLDESSRVEASFPPITVTELALNDMGTDPIFDWSIAELEVSE